MQSRSAGKGCWFGFCPTFQFHSILYFVGEVRKLERERERFQKQNNRATVRLYFAEGRYGNRRLICCDLMKPYAERFYYFVNLSMIVASNSAQWWVNDDT